MHKQEIDNPERKLQNEKNENYINTYYLLLD